MRSKKAKQLKRYIKSIYPEGLTNKFIKLKKGQIINIGNYKYYKLLKHFYKSDRNIKNKFIDTIGMGVQPKKDLESGLVQYNLDFEKGKENKTGV